MGSKFSVADRLDNIIDTCARNNVKIKNFRLTLIQLRRLQQEYGSEMSDEFPDEIMYVMWPIKELKLK